MPLVVDWVDNTIQVTSPDITIDAQTLHDFIEDQMASSRGSAVDDILKPEGKIEDPSQPGVYSQIILIWNSPWQIQFWQGSGYTRIFGAKMVGGLNDQVMKATGTGGDITVLESPVDGLTVEVASSVLSPEQDARLTNIEDLAESDEEKNVVTNKFYKRHKITKVILKEKNYNKDVDENETLIEP